MCLRCSKFVQVEIIFVCNVCRKLVETVGNSTLGRRKQPKLTKAAPHKSVAFESLESSKVKMRIFRPPPRLGRWPEYSLAGVALQHLEFCHPANRSSVHHRQQQQQVIMQPTHIYTHSTARENVRRIKERKHESQSAQSVRQTNNKH